MQTGITVNPAACRYGISRESSSVNSALTVARWYNIFLLSQGKLFGWCNVAYYTENNSPVIPIGLVATKLCCTWMTRLILRMEGWVGLYPCNYMDYGGGEWTPLNGRPGLRMAVWLQVKVCRHRQPTAYRVYARSVCDTKKRRCSCGMRVVALYKCYRNMPLPYCLKACCLKIPN